MTEKIGEMENEIKEGQKYKVRVKIRTRGINENH